MTLQAIFKQKQAKAALGGMLVTLLAWQLCPFQFMVWLSDLSYDLPFIFTAPSRPANVVLVEMDEISLADLKQTYGERWNRELHARLVDYLHNNGTDLIVFDMVFTEPDKDAAKDAELAQAIRNHGRVVLAADVDNSRRNGIVGAQILPPNDVLRNATSHWGPTQADIGDDGVVRKIYPGTELKPSLAWIAAALADSTTITTNANHFEQRWIRYYGPGGTLARISYSQATNTPSGFYAGKTVFIGGRPKTRFVAEEVDEFLTPWRRHGQPQISGLELTATEFLNLSRGDFLKRLPTTEEFLMLALLGILAGGGLACVRPVRAIILSLLGGLVVIAIAFTFFFQSNAWFTWSVVVLVQIPCALAWSLGLNWWRMKKEKEFLETPMLDSWDDFSPAHKTPPPAAPASAIAARESAPAIPDHELLRQVGRGAYGDVWLARDVLGNFHAVKIVRRMAFDHAAPYDREFRGLQKFTPLSREHPGLVHILHVGRNTTEDFFYYVMEAGDDEKSGATIEPATYTPRNLGRDLHRRAPFPPGECVEIMVALCDALEFLHSRGLIHRDIKPANIIFVNGRPKLADVGLVTDINPGFGQASLVGTEGYLPPEGPGTMSGDIFALGKVLEEMIRARDTKVPSPHDEARERLRSIVHKACADNPVERFAAAREMREALIKAMCEQI